MKILILGSSGYLGFRLSKLLQQRHEVFGTFNKSGNESDSTVRWFGDSNSLLEIIKQFQPKLVINCVGLADVDLCEVLPEKSFQLNQYDHNHNVLNYLLSTLTFYILYIILF
jgi:dTDP-4-dehydrorhamnose reductase